jgi:hypothetical protein
VAGRGVGARDHGRGRLSWHGFRVYDAHIPRICRDRVWQGENCTVNKPIDSFQGRPIVSQRAGRHYAEHHCFAYRSIHSRLLKTLGTST